MRDLQSQLNLSREHQRFAIGVFDCNNLKLINDKLGHIKGDMYLQSAVSIICRVFSRSPIFRIGGDEFAVILQGDDYRNRRRLTSIFETKIAKTASAEERWQQLSVAMGVAEFDPRIDKTVDDVFRRADNLMYENKRSQKGDKLGI